MNSATLTHSHITYTASTSVLELCRPSTLCLNKCCIFSGVCLNALRLYSFLKPWYCRQAVEHLWRCVFQHLCVSVFHHAVPDYKCPLSPLFHPPLPWAGGPVECARAQQMRANGRGRKRERIKQRSRKQQKEIPAHYLGSNVILTE